ncbi:MAG: hypothetical protein AAF438_07490 [Pseudomonadota bacterium]
MKNSIKSILAVATFAVITAPAAFACGESLFRVGKGVKYRAYSAPLPANVLVYATTDKEKEMATELARSGHGVYLVNSEEALAQQLGKGGYDVIIAPFSERQKVERSDSETSFLPITHDDTEASQVKDLYKRSVGSDDSVKKYLKAIHRTLKSA